MCSPFVRFRGSFLPLKQWSGAKFVLSLHDYSDVCGKKVLLYGAELCSGPAPLKCLGCTSAHFGPMKAAPTLVGNWATASWQARLVDRYLPVSHFVAVGNRLAERNLPFQILPNFLPDDQPATDGPFDAYLSQLPAQDFLLLAGDVTRFLAG